MTIQSALRMAIGQLKSVSPTPRLDAEVLIRHTLGKDRAYIHAWPENTLSAKESSRFRQLVESRTTGTPVAYLTGKKEFWSRDFLVSPSVLIPRPETEILVEIALEMLPNDPSISVLELGTGSGAIGITLAIERPATHILATDICKKALSVAKTNATRYGVMNLRIQQSDWYDDLPGTSFNLIVSNPPYVSESDPHLSRGDVRSEPRVALLGGPEGLDALTIIADRSRAKLRPNAYLLLEHGYQQTDQLRKILTELGYRDIQAYTDLQGHFRVTRALWTAVQ